jgi:hypothetical protein
MAIAGYLKQSTSVTIKVGPFVDSTDGNTDETALTISQADVRLAKNGGDLAQKNDAASLTHDEIGIYDCALNTTDTNTLGILSLFVHESGALPVRMDFMVLAANIYDSLIGGGDLLQIDLAQWLGTAAATPTVAGVPEVDLTHWIGVAAATPTVAGVPEVDVTHWIGVAAATPTVAGVPEVDVTHVLGSAAATPPTAAGIADAVWDEALAGHVVAGSTGEAQNAVDNIETDTQDIQSRLPAALTANGNIKASLVEILTTALTETAGLLAGGFKKFFNVAAPTGTLNSIPDAVPDAIGGLPITGTRLTSIPWNAAWDAEVQSEATDALNAYDPPTKAELDTAQAAIQTDIAAVPTAAEINAEVVDVLNVDTFAEPTGVPAATQTIRQMLHFVYAFAFRNKLTVTSSKKTYFGDDDAAEFEKDLSDDGNTYTESEINAL